MPTSARTLVTRVAGVLADPAAPVPDLLRQTLILVLDEVRALETRVHALEWAVPLAARRGHNKAAIAVANKLARIIWAVWRTEQAFYSPLADVAVSERRRARHTECSATTTDHGVIGRTDTEPGR